MKNSVTLLLEQLESRLTPSTLTLLGTDGLRHPTLATEENMGAFTQGTTFNEGVELKVVSLNPGESVNWTATWETGYGNDAMILPVTSVNPSTGTLDGNHLQQDIALGFNTTTLAPKTYHGELRADGPSTDRYFFSFTVNPGPFFRVTGYPPLVTAGSNNSFTVTAEDANGHTNTGYKGTVTFSATVKNATISQEKVVLPVNYTFTTADAGVHTFSAQFRTAGSQTLIVTDTVKSNITGTESGIIVNPSVPHHLAIARYPYKPVSGVQGSFRVTAQDLYSNTLNVTPFTDTVTFTSTDPLAILPPNYKFTAADKGVHDFVATLFAVGTQGITVLDVTNPTIIKATIPDILVQPAPMVSIWSTSYFDSKTLDEIV